MKKCITCFNFLLNRHKHELFFNEMIRLKEKNKLKTKIKK